jgi:hypothetical protein
MAGEDTPTSLPALVLESAPAVMDQAAELIDRLGNGSLSERREQEGPHRAGVAGAFRHALTGGPQLAG